jgi:hypothetical protein
MPPSPVPLTIQRHAVLLRAAHLCTLASLPLLTTKPHLQAQAQKDHIGAREDTEEAMGCKPLRKSFTHPVLARTMSRCFQDPAHSSRYRSRRLPVCMLHNNPSLLSYSCPPFGRLLREHTRIQLWRSNSKGKPSNSKNETLERRDVLVTMAQDSQTPSGPG